MGWLTLLGLMSGAVYLGLYLYREDKLPGLKKGDA
jgi:hypothetical protein